MNHRDEEWLYKFIIIMIVSMMLLSCGDSVGPQPDCTERYFPLRDSEGVVVDSVWQQTCVGHQSWRLP